MIYELPDGQIIDLGEYTIDDCVLIDCSSTEKELSDLMFEQNGIIIADLKGGEKVG